MSFQRSVFSSLFRSLSSLTGIRYAVAWFLLAGYLVPNSIVERFSLAWFFPVYEWHLVPLFVRIVLAALFSCVWVRLYPERNAGKSLWLIALMYFLFHLFKISQPYEYGRSESLLVIANCYAIGIFSGVVCCSVLSGLYLLCSICSIQCLYTLFIRFTGQDYFISGTMLRAGGTFHDPTPVCYFTMLCLPIAVALAVHSQQAITKRVMQVFVLLFLATLVLTWYRGGITACCVSLIWLMNRYIARDYKSLKRYCCGVLLLLLGIVYLYRTHSMIDLFSSNRSLFGRWLIWVEAITAFRQHLFLGVGLGGINLNAQLGSGLDAHHITSFPHCHNLLLQWFVEMGLFGGFAFCIFVVAIYFALRGKQGILLGLTSAWIALLIAGVTDVPFGVAHFQYEPITILVGFLLVLTLRVGSISEPQPAATPSREMRGNHAQTDQDKLRLRIL